LIYIR